MTLKAVHDKLDEIPEGYRDLYTEKNGKFELTGISGIQTDANVARLEAGIKKERDEHKATKAKLAAWGDLTPEDVHSKLDRIAELEAAAKGKLDESKIEEIVAKRVEGTLKSKLSPVERQLAAAMKERDELKTANTRYQESERARSIGDAVAKALQGAKVLPEAHEDALLLASRVFEISEDGKVQTRDGVGVPPGLDPASWLAEIQPRRPHWWPATQGGGARGSGPNGALSGQNPWSEDGWSLTAQGAYIRQHGEEKAAAMAKAVGSRIGATKPTPRKKG